MVLAVQLVKKCLLAVTVVEMIVDVLIVGHVMLVMFARGEC
jgi:hypothetical protein